MVQFIDLEKGDKLYAINLENKTLGLLVIIKTPYYIYHFGYKALILPIMSYINKECSVIIINLDKSKQSISFEEDTDRFIIISDKKVLKYFINHRD